MCSPITESEPADWISTEARRNNVARITRGLADGDENAFREFHNRYFDRLYQFLLAVSRGEEQQAKEALQETFIRVLRYAREFDDEEVFWCWLKKVARSAAQDHGRKHVRYLRLLHSFALRWTRVSPDKEHIDSPSIAFNECLSELTPTDKEMLECKYLDGLSVREISAQQNLTEKAVESRLVRLRKQLRESLLRKLKRS